jgi:hypothetical protein
VNGEEGRSVPRGMGTEAAIMKQPGFISGQLHPGGIAGQFRKAVSNPRFQSMLEEFPTSAVASAYLFKQVSVPWICGVVLSRFSYQF